MTSFRQFLEIFSHLDAASLVVNFLDILVVAYVFYRLILLTRGTRAWPIMWGLGIFFTFFMLMLLWVYRRQTRPLYQHLASLAVGED